MDTNKLETMIPPRYIDFIRDVDEAAVRHKISGIEGVIHPRNCDGKYIGVRFGWMEGWPGPIPHRFWVIVDDRDAGETSHELSFEKDVWQQWREFLEPIKSELQKILTPTKEQYGTIHKD